VRNANIVLTVPGGRADLSRKDAQWLSEHLPPAAMLRSQLQAAVGREKPTAHRIKHAEPRF